MTVIYCLAVIDGDPFYVGVTGDPHVRLINHRSRAKKGTEAKYQFIRDLWKAGDDFEMIILDTNPGVRYERWYHYLLGQEFDLTNEKMGDKAAREQEAMDEMKKKRLTFSSAPDFLTALDLEVKMIKARKKAAKTQARIRNQVYDDRTIFIDNVKDMNKRESQGLQSLKDKMAIQNLAARKYRDEQIEQRKIDQDIKTIADWEDEYYNVEKH